MVQKLCETYHWFVIVPVPADGVKGKTWGPSTAHQKERGHIIPQPHDNQKRWSKSAPNLEKSLRPLPYTATMTGLNQITAYGPEIGELMLSFQDYFTAGIRHFMKQNTLS